MRILIAEDDMASRMLLQKLLAKYGRCDAVENGRDALENFAAALREGRPYDLVCMDICMPEMDGQEALEAIRAAEREHAVPPGKEARALMVTVMDDVKTVSRAFFRGNADGYITKPVEVGELTAKLQKIGFSPKSENI